MRVPRTSPRCCVGPSLCQDHRVTSLVVELAPAVIGLVGALVGALIGLSSTWMATRYQALRTERELRRQIYTDFISTVIATQTFLDQNLRLFSNHADHEQALAEAKASGRRRDIAAAQQVVADDLPIIKANQTEFSNRLEQLVRESHRLKIAGHPLVWEASFAIYRALGHCLPWYPPELVHAAQQQVNDGLNHFAVVARADVKSPGSGGCQPYALIIRPYLQTGRRSKRWLRSTSRC